MIRNTVTDELYLETLGGIPWNQIGHPEEGRRTLPGAFFAALLMANTEFRPAKKQTKEPYKTIIAI